MKTISAGILALMLTVTSMTALAQQGPAPMQRGGQYNEDMDNAGPGRRGQGGPMSEEQREEVRKKVEAVRIWRLTEALKLDSATSAKVSALLSSQDRQRQDIQREQMDNLRALRLALEAKKPDETKLKALLEKQENNHRAMQELRGKERNGLKEILTIEQQARYVVFQQEFMREMRGMIQDARGDGPGKSGMGGGRMRGTAGPGNASGAPDK